MCGIWASVGIAADPTLIDLVSHRGPDGRGWKVLSSSAGPIALGHRRLAIIDTSTAALQPMCNTGGRYWIVYNGEVYNYRELRAELVQLGHRFRTQSDTEVILAAFAEWGEACLDRFIGMFAFVLYDAQNETLFAARDRFAIKPLYYALLPGGIAFASEIKQLLKLPGLVPRMNVARVYDFLATGITDHTAETLFADIRQIRNGECLSLTLRGMRLPNPLPVRRWYRLPPSGTVECSQEEAARRFHDLLSESVRLHLRSDVTVGSCLSGGLDSSAIVSLIARHFNAEGGRHALNTVSACYNERSVDERPFMQAVVTATGAVPHYIFPKPEDVFTCAEKLTWHQDEPYGSTSIFAQWCVFEEARRQGIKVMLDGQGADEQLAGYHGGFGYHLASLVRTGRWVELLRTILERRRFHGMSARQQFRSLIVPILPPSFVGILTRSRRAIVEHDWLASDRFRGEQYRPQSFAAMLQAEGLGPVRDIGDLCVAMTQATNLPMLLHYEDRNSMAHSVEARVPFLDHRLVEFSIGLGARHKIVGGTTKAVLRGAMTGVMPEKICRRQDKIGFATPEMEWFRGPLRRSIEGAVEDVLSQYAGLMNPGGTRAMVNEMLDGLRPIDFRLWRIVNIGIWGRVFGVAL
ncbi:MAG: asparagine synthase (glutamine-hydrolyzing) [Nitrospiraceae bacterium]